MYIFCYVDYKINNRFPRQYRDYHLKFGTFQFTRDGHDVLMSELRHDVAVSDDPVRGATIQKKKTD